MKPMQILSIAITLVLGVLLGRSCSQGPVAPAATGPAVLGTVAAPKQTQASRSIDRVHRSLHQVDRQRISSQCHRRLCCK